MRTIKHWILQYCFLLHSKINILYRAIKTNVFTTDIKRWSKNSNVAEQPSWEQRNKVIAKLIPPSNSVIDLGAGIQTLRNHLGSDCFYQPCDLVKRTDDTLLCDFNANRYPEIQRTFDYVVCSGVLEYIQSLDDFFTKISAFGTNFIISYSPFVKGQSKTRRTAHFGWINHLTQTELEELFKQAKLQWKEPKWINDQLVYELWK